MDSNGTVKSIEWLMGEVDGFRAALAQRDAEVARLSEQNRRLRVGLDNVLLARTWYELDPVGALRECEGQARSALAEAPRHE